MSIRTLLRALWIGCILFGAGILPASAETRHVILLFDERSELPGLATLDADFVRSLNSAGGDGIEIYREDMDLSRFGSEPYKDVLRNFLRAKYAHTKIDLIVPVMGPALDFVPSGEGAFRPEAPIVFCGVDSRYLAGRSLPPHVRGVILKREFAPTLEIALRLHPSTQGVVIAQGDLFQEPRARRAPSVRGYMILWNLAGAEGSELNNRFRMALAAALPALRAPASDPSDVELASISRPSSSNICQFQRQPPAESAQGRTLTSKKRYGSTPSIWDACQPFVRPRAGQLRAETLVAGLNRWNAWHKQ